MIHLVVLGARFFAPHDPTEQNRDFPFAPPMRLHWVDAQGRFHLRSFAYALVYHPESSATVPYEEDRTMTLPLRFFAIPASVHGDKSRTASRRIYVVDAPQRLFLLGTDGYGRDQLSRLLFGGQVSLFAGLLAAA